MVLGLLLNKATCMIGFGLDCNKEQATTIKNRVTNKARSALKIGTDQQCKNEIDQNIRINLSNINAIGKNSRCDFSNVQASAISRPKISCITKTENLKEIMQKMKSDMTNQIQQEQQDGFLSSGVKQKANVDNAVESIIDVETDLTQLQSCINRISQDSVINMENINCIDGGVVNVDSFKTSAVADPIMKCLGVIKNKENFSSDLDSAIDNSVDQKSTNPWVKILIAIAVIVVVFGIGYGIYKYSGDDEGEDMEFMYL